MGLKLFDWLRGRSGGSLVEVSCQELLAAAQEYQIRELAFWTCVDMIANAIGRCEFRTYRGGREIREEDYYLWNVEPNVNQNSTVFLHKLVAQLCKHNEALVVNPRQRDGHAALVVADSFEEPETAVTRMAEYRQVTVEDFTFRKTFREDDVLHLRLNHTDLTPVIEGLYRSYYKMVDAAVRSYQWGSGQHWKVHVSQLAQGDPEFQASFMRMIQDQVKPFLESSGAILPEFDGYEFSSVGGGESRVKRDTRDIKALVEDIFDFTARTFLIPPVLVKGEVESTRDANERFLTYCIDPICDQLQEEINRKFYGYDRWRAGEYLQVDSTSIIHFDLFANAAGVEKLVGSAAFSINDVRRAAGQAAIDEPWADQHWMTRNIAAMGEQAQSIQTGGET